VAVQLDFAPCCSSGRCWLRGVAFTVGLTAVSAVLGVALGVACAWARLGPALAAARDRRCTSS
jgi:polar amino acid transport system permease protein